VSGENNGLDLFRPSTREWFRRTFPAPTAAQLGAWRSIASGAHTLVIAPTGSGKTLSAFLWTIDRLLHREQPVDGVATLYISPLKALAVDVERNLRAPLAGIVAQAQRLKHSVQPVEVGIRSGDTTAADRRRLTRNPPEILITTPESFYLMLTSQARETLRAVDTVIVDEIHAVAATKRGSHLALSLARLDRLLAAPAQRIGLSATVEPAAEVATFLGGNRDVAVVDAREHKVVEVTIEVPVEDLADLRATAPPRPGASPAAAEKAPPSIWPHVEARVLELVRDHRSTIIFANSRRLAERFCARLNELAGEELARTHHGSVSHAQRARIEQALKAGELAAVVATSSLELGIDMGAVDLVVQIEAPASVASGLQRIGRAGHQVGAPSHGIVFPKYRGDLLEAAVVGERMSAGHIEAMRFPRNPLDVLAQQIVAMVALEEWSLDDLETVVRSAAPYAEITRPALEAVLDMLAGRYPSDAFAGLRARINWDRVNDRLSARSGSHNIAVTSGGTIPDRGLFGVFLAGERRTRVGELDEEMVFESRVGEVFVLGSSSWCIEEISTDRVLVSPAPGQPGRMPFWHGEAPGRPIELGRSIGAFVRELGGLDGEERLARVGATGCDANAANNLVRYLDDQRQATGIVPDDRTVVVERFRDAIGDWRVCIHTFFGARVHAPWSQAVRARLRSELGLDTQVIYGDDGIVIRVPDGDVLPALDLFFPAADEVEDLVIAEVASSALFASRFREAAARALLLPRRRPGARTPLWLQRQKASTLLEIAATYDSFPIVLEAYRECLQDVFDVPALQQLLAAVERREVRVSEVETPAPSPFAASLQLAYVGAFMYDGDAPMAERRAQALALDRGALAELMGHEELRDLLDPAVIESVESEAQRRGDGRRARNADEVHDLLRELGALGEDGLRARVDEPARLPQHLRTLESSHRAVALSLGGATRWIAIEDSGLYRDAYAVALPEPIPDAFLASVEDPVGVLVRRFARCHAPFTEAELAAALGMGEGVVRPATHRLQERGELVRGEFRPGGSEREWVAPEILRRIRRRSLAALRREVEPVPQEALARLATAWHGVGPHDQRWAGVDGLWNVIGQLQGLPLPASVFERQILPSRLPGYSAAALDELGAGGDLAWTGAGTIGARDGWIVVARAHQAALHLPPPSTAPLSELATAVHDTLQSRGALFFRQLSDLLGGPPDERLVDALWELLWHSRITNDTLAPLRAFLRGTRLRRDRGTSGRTPRGPRQQGPPAGAGRWSTTPPVEDDDTRRRHAAAEQTLERNGLVTRETVIAERTSGGFAAVYPVLRAFEERGLCRRGYFVEGLGGAQFALPGAVDRMRALAGEAPGSDTIVLAAADPANPFGATLPWPPSRATGPARPGRKSGASVVVADGRLLLYLESGGRTALTYTAQPDELAAAARALVGAARTGHIPHSEIRTADAEPIRTSALAGALEAAGAQRTVKGYEI